MIRLSKKFIRRVITGLALLAPVVYLFGSQFFALNGAHGEEVFAEPIYQDEYIETDSITADGEYKVSFGPIQSFFSSDSFSQRRFTFAFNYGNDDRNYIEFFSYQGARYMTFGFVIGGYTDVARYTIETSLYTEFRPSPWVLFTDSSCASFVDFLSLNNVDYTLYRLTSVPTAVVPENSGAYTEYIFGDMFGKSNFLTTWGQDAISDNPHGFAPFGNMLQFVDENMLHLSDLQIGLMAYGYFYYCAHVLLFVCFFDLTTFFLSWILRISHKFGGADYED